MKILHEKLRNPFVTDTRPGRIIFLEVWEIVIYLEIGRHESNLFVFCNSITSMKLLRQVLIRITWIVEPRFVRSHATFT